MKWIRKLTESEHNIIKSILENDNGLKITAVAIALFMFITVNQIGNPIWKNYFGDTEYIEGVPLTVKYDTDKYVISGVPQSININVSGSENNVQSTLNSKDNLVATLPLSYKSSGSYTINSNLVEFNNTANVQITPATSSFEVVIQNKTTENRSVDIGYINGNNRLEGIILEQPDLKQKVVQITGGTNDVANVVSVRGQIDLNQLPESSSKENTTALSISLVPYDRQGEVVTGVGINPSSIIVEQTYTKGSISLPIQFNYNNDDNQYIQAICEQSEKECTKVNQIMVKVYGEKSKIEKLTSVAFDINKDTLDETTSLVKILPVLESGVFVVKDTPTEIKIKTESGISRTIKDVEVEIENLKSGFKVKENPVVNVTVIGRKKEVEALEVDDIKVTIDASNIKEIGSYQMNYQVNDGEKYDITLSSDTIAIEIEEK